MVTSNIWILLKKKIFKGILWEIVTVQKDKIDKKLSPKVDKTIRPCRTRGQKGWRRGSKDVATGVKRCGSGGKKTVGNAPLTPSLIRGSNRVAQR